MISGACASELLRPPAGQPCLTPLWSVHLGRESIRHVVQHPFRDATTLSDLLQSYGPVLLDAQLAWFVQVRPMIVANSAATAVVPPANTEVIRRYATNRPARCAA